jgi:dipeptidyl-peptidase-3
MEKYSERFNDIAILQLDMEGFDKLSENQKKLAYHLSNAGLWGRMISVDQGSQHNIPFFSSLIELHEQLNTEDSLYQQVHDSLFILFAHNGIYHSTSGEKLTLPLDLSALDSYSNNAPELVENIKSIWFSNTLPQFRTVQTDGVDVVKESGGNFYHNMTTEEATNYRLNNYPKIEGNEIPPFGFNERLVKDTNGNIFREVISENGLYGSYVKEIIKHLTLAVPFSENEKQSQSITTLIDFYKTGDAVDFDKHCVAWTQDQDSDIYFINGLIESYEDPLGIGCTFESIVAFKNPLQTAKVNKIIENIQWFENNLPFDQSFKKDKAVGLSASSINVISMAGDTAPSLPLGINLPNSDWIRSKHGSKSVNLANVSSARSSYEVQLREALFLPKYHNVLETYGNLTNSLHVDLHEIAGHGSGKVLDGVNTEILGVYYSTIEESRADLVALYYIAEPKLKEFGVYDKKIEVEDAALAQYVSYLTNGAIAQLRRVDLGNDLTQAHFRNRQLIALWVLENADPTKVNMVEKDGNHYIEVHDVQYVKHMFGQLLEKIQTIKSTGNLEAAKDIVMTYGTKVNQDLHKELLERLSKLDMPKVVGFNTPMLIEHNNTIEIKQSTNFFEQQMDLYKKHTAPVIEKKKNLGLK